jgi:hypothetical protein
MDSMPGKRAYRRSPSKTTIIRLRSDILVVPSEPYLGGKEYHRSSRATPIGAHATRATA